MRQIIRLAKNGGSLAFHVSKVIKKARLDWEEDQYFAVEEKNAETITITRISMNDRKSPSKKKSLKSELVKDHDQKQ